jgi:hypothetical protein
MPAGSLHDWTEGIPYRMAYAVAHDWRERRPVNDAGRDPSAAEIASLVAEARRLGEQVGEDLIREAIDDALAGRRPRW